MDASQDVDGVASPPFMTGKAPESYHDTALNAPLDRAAKIIVGRLVKTESSYCLWQTGARVNAAGTLQIGYAAVLQHSKIDHSSAIYPVIDCREAGPAMRGLDLDYAPVAMTGIRSIMGQERYATNVTAPKTVRERTARILHSLLDSTDFTLPDIWHIGKTIGELAESDRKLPDVSNLKRDLPMALSIEQTGKERSHKRGNPSLLWRFKEGERVV